MLANPFSSFAPFQTIDENLNFDEQILEAAKSITNAAGVLIKAATAAQKELVSQGKVSWPAKAAGCPFFIPVLNLY